MDGLAIAACIGELRESLVDGVIQKIRQPTRDRVVLQVRGTQSHRLIIEPKAASLHRTTAEYESPQAPFSFLMLLRRHLRGGRITAIRQRGWDRVVTFDVERRIDGAAVTYELVCELVGVRGNLVLLKDNRILGAMRPDGRNAVGATYRPLPPQSKDDPRTAVLEEVATDATEEEVARFLVRTVDGVGRRTAEDIVSRTGDVAALDLAQRLRSSLDSVLAAIPNPQPAYIPSEERATFYRMTGRSEPMATFGEALDRALVARRAAQQDRSDEQAMVVPLQRALAKARRTQEKLRDWLEHASSSDALQASADLLMIHQNEIERGSDSVEVIDPATEQPVRLRLDPSLSAIENAQRMYERAKRMRRGVPQVRVRLCRLDREVAILAEAIKQAERGETVDGRALGLLPNRPNRRKGPVPPSGPKQFEVEGFAILVGRSAKENDRVLRSAAPDDLWLHVRDGAGSHVVVRRRGAHEIPRSVVVEAARLAAQHSKHKSERKAEVVVTEVRNVRKPKGAPDGLAIVRNEDTLTVNLDPVERNE